MQHANLSDPRADDILPDRMTRRRFLRAATATSMALTLPHVSAATLGPLKKPVRIGMIADLHQDVMHDGIARMEAFLEAMATQCPDAIMQLGDFAYPNTNNRQVIEMFNQGHERSLHVIGNHDTDAGYTKQQCLDVWGMPGRYSARNIEGLQLLILDGNDGGSPTHKGGYPSYVGQEQAMWLKEQLATLDGPVIVASHQPLAGAWAVDNAEEIQTILGAAADKVLLVMNGHSHLDDVLRIQGVTYWHVNSASYQWVGSAHKHESYAKDVHARYPWISHTCPYRDSLFAMLTVDPQSLTLHVEGRRSQWVGKSPAELGRDLDAKLTHGEQIAPRIRDRRILRVAK